MTYFEFEKKEININIRQARKQFKFSIFVILLCVSGIAINFPGLIVVSPSKLGCVCVGINIANILFIMSSFVFEAIEYKDLLFRKRFIEEFEMKRNEDLKNGIHDDFPGFLNSREHVLDVMLYATGKSPSSGLPK